MVCIQAQKEPRAAQRQILDTSPLSAVKSGYAKFYLTLTLKIEQTWNDACVFVTPGPRSFVFMVSVSKLSSLGGPGNVNTVLFLTRLPNHSKQHASNLGNALAEPINVRDHGGPTTI